MTDHTIDTQEYKICKKCGELYPATPEYFHRKGSGLRNACKQCINKQVHEIRSKKPGYFKDWYRSNPEARRAYLKNWYEENRERLKEYDKRRYPGRREKTRRQHRQHYLDHTEEYKRRATAWKRKNRERYRLLARVAAHKYRERKLRAGGSYTPEDIKALYQQQKGRCWYCGANLKKGYHIDHRIPLSRGGSNGLRNICLTCPHCNWSKGAKMPHEWGERLI